MSGQAATADHVRLAARRVADLLPGRADLTAMARNPRRDLVAGVTVSIVALPLALAFGITSGLGATAGLVTAVVAGFVAAAFGGSELQVSGPTGAMTVVLVPIVAAHGPGGVLVVGMLAGLLLIGFAVARLGRLMRYIPLPVVEGFTVGIAVIIALQQLPAMLGVHGEGERVLAVAWSAVSGWAAEPHWQSVAIATGVAAAMLVSARVRPALPMSILAVAAATVAVRAFDVSTPAIGTVPSGLPAPHLPSVPLDALPGLLTPAVAIAALAALESLLSATVADGMRVGERHDSDRELFGQGLANLAAPLFGGVPATAAIARTAVNVRAGARSRLAAMTHAVVLLAVVYGASTVVSDIPLAALAGVLIATAVQMVEVSSVRALLRSTRGDAAVLVLTAVTTIALDLVTAVVVGIIAAGALALRHIARSVRFDVEPLPAGDHVDEESALLDEHIVAYRIEGPLFFGAAHAFLLELAEVSDVRVVVLRMSHIATMDATSAAVLADTIRRLEARGITVLLSGTRPQHTNVLAQLGVYDQIAHEKHLFATTPDAIEHARAHARRVSH